MPGRRPCPYRPAREPEQKVILMRKPDMTDRAAAAPGAPESQTVVTEQPPLALRAALWALARCVMSTAQLLRRRRLHLPSGHVGLRLHFADGTSAQPKAKSLPPCAR